MKGWNKPKTPEQQAARWENLGIPITQVLDQHQSSNTVCDCGSGKAHADCCARPAAADFLIKGYRTLQAVLSLKPDYWTATKLLSRLPDRSFISTTIANLHRVQNDGITNPDPLPTILYHVTTVQNAERILRDGLQPASRTGQDNFANQGLTAHPEHVYMTEANIYFYASHLFNDEKPVTVFAIDTAQLNHDLFFPDEDYAALLVDLTAGTHVFGRVNESITHKDSITAARDAINQYKSLWLSSLSGYGNVAYRGVVPPSAVKKMDGHVGLCSANNVRLNFGADYLLAGYPILKKELLAQQSSWLQGMKPVEASSCS
jgi:hypothetical protein